jgi:hypothetical protein
LCLCNGFIVTDRNKKPMKHWVRSTCLSESHHIYWYMREERVTCVGQCGHSEELISDWLLHFAGEAVSCRNGVYKLNLTCLGSIEEAELEPVHRVSSPPSRQRFLPNQASSTRSMRWIFEDGTQRHYFEITQDRLTGDLRGPTVAG